jgi:hypothetical protein
MRNGIRIGDLRDMEFFETRLRGLVKQLEGVCVCVCVCVWCVCVWCVCVCVCVWCVYFVLWKLDKRHFIF